MTGDARARTTDPDGREVVFDDSAYRHLRDRRTALLEHIDLILATVALPDYRAHDREPGRERFFRQNIVDPGRWLRVVVDFNGVPGRIVTALVQYNDPRQKS